MIAVVPQVPAAVPRGAGWEGGEDPGVFPRQVLQGQVPGAVGRRDQR